MGTVFELNRRGIYSVESAREILPLVYKITSEIDEEMQTLKGQISAAQQLEDLQKSQQLEESAQALLERWESKVLKLGLAPKGMWLVDFDMGRGYFCWKYPELDIKFWHGYNDGFSGRRPIEDNAEESLNI